MSRKNYQDSFLSSSRNVQVNGGEVGVEILVQTFNTQIKGHNSVQLLKELSCL